MGPGPAERAPGAYALSWWSALWPTFVLIDFAFLAASLFFRGLLALGLLG